MLRTDVRPHSACVRHGTPRLHADPSITAVPLPCCVPPDHAPLQSQHQSSAPQPSHVCLPPRRQYPCRFFSHPCMRALRRLRLAVPPSSAHRRIVYFRSRKAGARQSCIPSPYICARSFLLPCRAHCSLWHRVVFLFYLYNPYSLLLFSGIAGMIGMLRRIYRYPYIILYPF